MAPDDGEQVLDEVWNLGSMFSKAERMDLEEALYVETERTYEAHSALAEERSDLGDRWKFALYSLVVGAARKGVTDEQLFRSTDLLFEGLRSSVSTEWIFSLAMTLRRKSFPIARRLLAIVVGRSAEDGHEGNVTSLRMAAIAYNEIAFHGYLPERRYKKAERSLYSAVRLMAKLSDEKELANLKLNLARARFLGRSLIDLEDVERQTQTLENAGDERAKKGYNLIACARG